LIKTKDKREKIKVRENGRDIARGGARKMTKEEKRLTRDNTISYVIPTEPALGGEESPMIRLFVEWLSRLAGG
jgi:hypothetical protein